jgi:NRPS condensation-like uncharacterized protein
MLWLNNLKEILWQGEFMSKHTKRQYRAEVWDNMQYLFGRFNDHQVRGVIRFAAHIDENRLKHALDLSAEYAYPLLSCRLADHPIRLCWEETAFTAKDMLLIKETENIDEAIQAQLCCNIDEYSGPQIKVTIVRSRETDTLCINMNHMLCDGAGFKQFLYTLSGIYSQLKENPDFKPDYAMGCRSTHQVVRTFGLKQRAKTRLKRYKVSGYEKNISFILQGNRSNPFVVTHMLNQQRFLAIKSYAKRHGATINDVFLTAYLRALYKLSNGYVSAIQCVSDLRKFLPGNQPAAFCNLTADMLCDIGPDIGASFEDTLKKVKKAMDAEKTNMEWLNLIMLLEAVFSFLPHRVARKIVLKEYQNPPIAMSNIGIIDHNQLSFDCLEITGAYVTGSIKYNPFLLLSLSTFNDEVTCSACFHGTQADKEKLSLLLKTIDEEIPLQ